MMSRPFDDPDESQPLRTIALAMLVALLGFLVGRYAWPATVIESDAWAFPFPVVVELEPDCGVPVRSPRPRHRATREPTGTPPTRGLDQLPGAERADAGVDRTALLRWVGVRSPALRVCTTSESGSVAHVSVSVRARIDDEGHFDRVIVRDPHRLVTTDMEDCLKEKMMEWTLPVALRPGAHDLMFSLSL